MLDGGALLKPALSRGSLRCIGASSMDKFKKTIEKDAALERRFQQVRQGQLRVVQVCVCGTLSQHKLLGSILHLHQPNLVF